MLRREVVFGALGALVLAGELAVGIRLGPVLAPAASATAAPKPVAPVPLPLALPGRLAFVLRGDIYVASDGAYRPVTADGRSIQPALSADGATLVFTRIETISGTRVVDGKMVPAELGFSRIVRKPVAGGAEEVLVEGLRQRAPNGLHLVSWYLAPALAPDGKRLALTEDDGDGASDLESIDLATPGRRPVTILSTGAQVADPAWSPDGRTLAVTSYNTELAGILLWPAGGGAPQRLKLPAGVEAYRPSYSPDGRWVVHTQRRDGRNDVHAIDPATGSDVALTSDGRSWNGVLSPDGRWLAYLAEERGIVDLWVMELADALAGGAPKAPRRLTHGEGIAGDSRPSWSR